MLGQNLEKSPPGRRCTVYTFHVGNAGLTAPLSGEEIGQEVTLAAAGPADLTGATFQYRRADTDVSADVPASAESVAVLLDQGDVTKDGTDLDSLAPPTSVESYALVEAEDRVEASPDTLAPPYLDQDAGKIVAPVTDDDAKTDVTTAINLTDVPVDEGSDDTSVNDADDATVVPTTRVVERSQAEPDSIADEVLVHGDSGGPVYTVKSNGHVNAKGSISGSGCASVSDDSECGDGWDGNCTVFFTDIALAEKALPGRGK
ncbi:hypothetical protein [Streptomyces sp. NPDC101234]|uniref:hypothetical protein n=1 Tax=Streptomyces sp. NPDC101234 TaxID=3366138 RepID=UPI0037F668EC